MTIKFGPYFPFRRDNRKSDGTWDAPDATDENIKGTSVDLYEPRWPRWKQKPPLHGAGDFVSDDPYFDIDEISQKVQFYPPGRALTDKNIGGHPASRQRVGDMPGGNFWRRRLLLGRLGGESYASSAHEAAPENKPSNVKPFGIDAASKRSTGPFDANGVREGLFTDESRSTRLAAAEPLAPPNKQTQRTARLLPGYRVQAIPQPAVPGEHRFTIRLSRGQPQTNLGGALIGHIRRSGGAYDPDGNFHPVTEFGPAEFDEIVTFLRKTEQQGPPDLVDTWKFIDLPPGWRSEVEATATWSYVDKLTRPDAEKLGFKLNPWSGNMWSTDKPVDWSATNFRNIRTHSSDQP